MEKRVLSSTNMKYMNLIYFMILLQRAERYFLGLYCIPNRLQRNIGPIQKMMLIFPWARELSSMNSMKQKKIWQQNFSFSKQVLILSALLASFSWQILLIFCSAHHSSFRSAGLHLRAFLVLLKIGSFWNTYDMKASHKLGKKTANEGIECKLVWITRNRLLMSPVPRYGAVQENLL